MSRVRASTAFAGALALGGATLAFAAGGTAPTRLDWPHRGEFVEYHGCGCADACWVAQVRRRSGAVRATLRCDCTTLFYRVAPARTETAHPLSCAQFEGNDKFGAIPAELERLLRSRGAGR